MGNIIEKIVGLVRTQTQLVDENWEPLGSATNEAINVGGLAARVTASFNRPADTSAYVSTDLVTNSTTAGSVAPLTLQVGRESSGYPASSMLRRLKLRKSGTSLTNASFRVHLYSASPTPANGDNGAWSTDQAAGYLGAVDITMDRAFTDGAVGVGVPAAGSDITIDTQTIYALIEARAAYTPASGETFALTAEVLRN